MRRFTTLEMSVAMDRYNEVVTGTDVIDYWGWLAVDWDAALIAQNKDPNSVGMFYISDAAAARLDILLSPHYRTLMKAYQIKYGKNHEQSRHQGLHGSSRR